MRPIQLQAAGCWWKSWRFWLLAALAAQYAMLQIATGVEYMDAPRNLHWGIYLVEQPRFLIDAEDVYNRIAGFPPTPAALAPAGAATGHSAPLHSWWGPLYIILFGAVWWITGSYAALRLVVPLAAGATVLLTYAFGTRYFNARVGLLAAVLLALFPIYREHAAIAFVEPISALLIMGALWAVLARRTGLAALIGALTVLGKIDLIVLYFGTIIFTALISARAPGQRLPTRHLAICVAAPLLVLLPWLYLTYVLNARPSAVAGGPRLDIFLTLAPLMLDQLFTIRPILALSLLGLFGAAAGWSLWLRKSAAPLVYRFLAVWLALGGLVMAVYTATPGASNNPRVLIPALPALCLLAADGFDRMRPRLSRMALCYMLALFVLLDGIGVWYQVLQARAAYSNMPAWEALRGQPRGYVLTADIWNAALYARQPVTWFDSDITFQHNILQHLEHFQSYIASAPIRYIVLPRDEHTAPAYMRSPAAQLYERLPIGRSLGWTQTEPVAPEVRAFLEQHYQEQSAGDMVIFTIDGQSGLPRAPAKYSE
ncbi:MAG TPA: hypothetical protein VKE41_00195 [Roseiflexaceae bacterium]|nr:hypothetical protein [Roseiflexaceae bacterium]